MKVSDIRLADYLELAKQRNRTLLVNSIDVSPYLAYITLKELFGTPEDIFEESKSQWSYTLKVPEATLVIYEWRITSCSLEIYADSGDVEEAEKISQGFLEVLRKQSAKLAPRIKEAAARAKSFLVQNPFSLYYQSAQNILIHLSGGEPSIDNVVSVTIDDEWASDLCRSAFFLFIAAFEGLLNLIYDLYLKTELRDERIYDRLSKEQIDIKVRLAPIYCECFKPELIDYESEVFKKFHSVVNLRNDFIHANLTKTMRHPIISEDECVFIIDNSAHDKSGLPKNIGDLALDDVLLVEKSIDTMIDFLLNCMKPRYKREFSSIMHKEFVQVVVEEGELIVVTNNED